MTRSCKKVRKNKSICELRSTKNGKVNGYIIFTELSTRMKIEVNLYGLPSGLRGFHIHERGNLLNGCHSLCAHFNPTNKEHGDINESNSHAGDLGNIEVKSNGKCKCILYSKFIRNTGKKFNIIGRSVVIHSKEDDLGYGNNNDSLITGNSGSRISCGVIGIF